MVYTARKKCLSMILAMAMVMSLMPALTLPAKAVIGDHMKRAALNSVLWSDATFGGNNFSDAAVPSGFTPYSVDENGTICAIDASSGEIQWRSYNSTSWSSFNTDYAFPVASIPSGYQPLCFYNTTPFIINPSTGGIQYDLTTGYETGAPGWEDTVAIPSGYEPLGGYFILSGYINKIVLKHSTTGQICERATTESNYGANIGTFPDLPAGYTYAGLGYENNTLYMYAIGSEVVAPTVTTSGVTTYSSTTATMGGNVTGDGGASVTGRGVVYSSTDATPTIGEAGVTQDANGTGTGSFSESVGGLTPNKTYYVRAYATNSVGTSYGSVVSFTTAAPMVTSVSVPSNGTYKIGDALDFTVTFDSDVIVTGTPRIPVTLNTGGTVYASYVSGSNSKNLVFRYTVASGNLDANGITLGSAISLNSGTIKNSSGDDAELNLYSVAATTNVLVDGIAPFISSVSHPSSATYNISNNLDYTVNFSEPVSVVTTGGTPYLTLTVGGSTVHAAYNSGSDTTALTFRYTVASGDTDADGVALSSNITLNSGTIKDAAGNDATLTFIGGTAAGVLVSTAPTVTDARISISGGTGTGGAYKIGDTVTATWNNTAGGDNNSAAITSVTVDFSQFGGGAAVAATNHSGTWTATYTIIAGAIDATNRNVSVTATDNTSKSTTTADTTNATVDNVAPTVTDGNISISGGTGVGGAYKIGDTVTATWNNTAGGDNNTDTISGVTVDFSAFGGGAAVAGTNSSGTWTAAFTIVAGAVDGTNRNVSVTATDNAGNITTTADTTNATVDNVAPTVTDGNISISGGTGTGGAFKSGDTVTATWNNTAGGDNNSDITSVTADFSQFGGGAAVAATNLSGTWTATYTITSGAMDATNRNVSFTVTDNAGNTTTRNDTTNATVDNIAPTVSISSTAGANTNTSPISITITFSESVTGFVVGDITVGNGTAGNFVAVSDTTYTADIMPSAQGAVTVDVAANVAQDAAGNNNTAATQLSRNYDNAAPTVTITSTAQTNTNTSPMSVTFTFSESVTGFDVGDITVGNGTAGNFVAVSGTTYTADITPSAQGVVTVDVAANVALDATGNNNTAATQLSRSYDTTAPAVGGAGTISAGTVTSSTAPLSWTAATDNITAAANLQYKVVYSTSNNIANLSDAKTNGTTFGNWTANLISTTVTGLSPSTPYYFNVIIKDAAGNEAVYTAITANTTAAPSSSGGTTTPPANTVVEVNGQKQDAGTASTQTTGGQTVTTIKVDDTKLNKILDAGGEKPTVTLPTNKASDVVVGELNGQTVKNMEQKEAVLVIKTESVSYTLPAAQINIDDVSSQIGEQVALKDIKVSVKIAEPSADTVKIVENTAAKNSYQIVVKPVEFEITCTSGSKTVDVSKFNGYVERTVAIPDGIDPSKITTGIVLNNDGTFSHVPTQIVVINGKYYAKINSLTNSTYSVIYNPVAFADVASHWAKDAINDMGSRMVVTGIGNSTYEPERSITRAEFAAIVVRALGLRQGTEESSFGDVTLTDWFNGYVDTATAYALITGYDSKAFGPSDTITREQAMAIIARAMKLTELSENPTDKEIDAILAKYTDGTAVSNYAKLGVAACVKSGIVSGTSESTLSPKVYVTRAEVAVMIQHLLEKSGLI